jgi:hypothetical protein
MPRAGHELRAGDRRRCRGHEEHNEHGHVFRHGVFLGVVWGVEV